MQDEEEEGWVHCDEEDSHGINRALEPERYDLPGVTGGVGLSNLGAATAAAIFGGTTTLPEPAAATAAGAETGEQKTGAGEGNGHNGSHEAASGAAGGGADGDAKSGSFSASASLAGVDCLGSSCDRQPCANLIRAVAEERGDQHMDHVAEDQVLPIGEEPVVAGSVPEVPNIGMRSSMATLEDECRYNPSKREKIQRLARFYDHWRPVRGDGNCYYRTVAFGALEWLLSTGDCGRLERLHEALAAVQYEDCDEHKAHQELLRRLRAWSAVAQLEDGIANNDTLDIALIRACRRLVRDFLFEHAEQYAPNGLTYEELVCALDASYKGVEDFCARVVDPMGRDAETLALDILPVQLGLGVRLWILDRRDGVDLVNVDFPGPSGGVDVHVLFKPGHYDLLYPRRTPNGSGAAAWGLEVRGACADPWAAEAAI